MLNLRFKKILLIGLMLPLIAVNGATEAAQPPSATAAGETSQKLDGSTYYLHISSKYGYMVICPKRPNVVIEASEFYGEPRQGEVLIFENDGNNVKKAWGILKNDAEGSDLPDLNTLTQEQANKLLENMKLSAGYEGVALINISENNRGVFAVTGKNIEIDTDGDGVADAVAVADTQNAKLFFRGNHGGRFLVDLIDNPIPREESVIEFQRCLGSFNELTAEEIGKMKTEGAKKGA